MISDMINRMLYNERKRLIEKENMSLEEARKVAPGLVLEEISEALDASGFTEEQLELILSSWEEE